MTTNTEALAALSYAEAAKLLADGLDYKYQRGIDPHMGEWREAVTLLRRLAAVEAERAAPSEPMADTPPKFAAEPDSFDDYWMARWFDTEALTDEFKATPVREIARQAWEAATPAAPAPAPADKWEGAEEWMPLAWELCAEECGEEACTELVWEGGPIPEPWGDRWLKYEHEAKRLIALVRKCVPALTAAGHAPKPLTDADVVEGWRTTEAARDDYGWNSCEWFQAGVRFAQRHYGITGDKHE